MASILRLHVIFVGGDDVTLPVTLDSSVPSLSLAGGPQRLAYTVQNPLPRAISVENIAAQVIGGDAALVDLTVLDTVLAIPAGGSASSSFTITPNQEITEGVSLEVELHGIGA